MKKIGPDMISVIGTGRNKDISIEVSAIVDDDTGVEYLIVSSLDYDGLAITPRYEADGSLKVRK